MQIRSGHVGPERTGRVRTGHEGVDGPVAAFVLRRDVRGELDGAGDLPQRALADLEAGQDVVREPVPRVVDGQPVLGGSEPAVQSHLDQALEEGLLGPVAPVEAADAHAGVCGDGGDRWQSDVTEFLALHHPDVVVVNVAGRRVLGREALGQAMTAGLNSPLARVFTRLEIEDIRFLRPDVALVSCVKHISDERGAGTARPARGSLSFTVVRDSARWQIAVAQTTPVP